MSRIIRSSMRTLIQIRQSICQVLETRKIMNWQEIVNVGQCGLYATRQWLIAWRAKQRIQPDETMAVALQASHFTFEEVHITAVPTVTDNEHNRAAPKHASAPFKVEHLK